MNYLSLNIRHLRGLKKLTQLQFSEIIGTKRTNIATWESGPKTFKPDELLKIMEYFGVSADDLLLKDLSKGGESGDKYEVAGKEKDGMQIVEESHEVYQTGKSEITNYRQRIKDLEELLESRKHEIEYLNKIIGLLEEKEKKPKNKIS